jgi:hypothetical protein
MSYQPAARKEGECGGKKQKKKKKRGSQRDCFLH